MPPTPASVVVGVVPVARREPTPVTPEGLEPVLREIRAVREMQERILAMLQASLYGTESGAPEAGEGEFEAGSLAPIRAPRRKSVLLIDDEARSREAAVRELTQADVPVRAVADGNEALRAIVEEKPDVIALELGLGGEMGGKDLINVIKATMEWVDIPIVLWTREPVASQKEARQVHGADEVALKAGGPAGLLARVITIFRRG
jgi:CheY-like chemotaxis protein